MSAAAEQRRAAATERAELEGSLHSAHEARARLQAQLASTDKARRADGRDGGAACVAAGAL